MSSWTFTVLVSNEGDASSDHEIPMKHDDYMDAARCTPWKEKIRFMNEEVLPSLCAHERLYQGNVRHSWVLHTLSRKVTFIRLIRKQSLTCKMWSWIITFNYDKTLPCDGIINSHAGAMTATPGCCAYWAMSVEGMRGSSDMLMKPKM